MPSSKKRTTMAKIARENKLRERRMEKQARKDARKFAAANPQPDPEVDGPLGPDHDTAEPEQPTEPVAGPTET
jgi:hypothetical protein